MNTTGLLHQYTELRDLGQGAQGRVVLARHTGSSELVAIKLLSPDLLHDEHLVSGFRREAELLSQVRNPHVAQVREYLQSGEQVAIVMEAVNGVSLHKVLEAHRKLTAEAALLVLKGSLLGLDAAHQRGIVHRDYKPANVMVQEDGQSKLIDFGVATLAGERSMSGTPAYMAPEQWRREEASPATDVYAATCVFYECVAGHRPFRAETRAEMAVQHLHSPVPLTDFPEELRGIVTAGMAKDPADRPIQASAFVRWLEEVAADTYGQDWEIRGISALAAGAALLAVSLPLATLTFNPGITHTSTNLANTTLPRGAGNSGLQAKVGSGKITVFGAGALAVGIACWMMFSGPDIGGTSTASYEQWFDNSALLTGNESIPQGSKAGPGVRYRLSMSPARAEPGTRITLSSNVEARATWGLEYLSENNYRCHEPESKKTNPFRQSYSFGISYLFEGEESRQGTRAVWLYPEGNTVGLPKGTTKIKIPARYSTIEKPSYYRSSECAWSFLIEETYTFTLSLGIKPGAYLISAYSPPGLIDSAARGSTSIPLESVGLRTEGRLPKIIISD
ncbi:serine/threonine-protein kinase [Actinocorallia libanotica]|uniref:Protein kinase domain-containing protein n=1 Tax=Actinocorallia libanotica TaxID=46162 RepID=A0ABN1R5K7_9ACTN